MRILIDDFVQYSDAPDTLKSPALAETTTFTSIDIDLGEVRTINCIGIGNTEALEVTVNGQSISLQSSDKNGLYSLNSEITAQVITVEFSSSFKVGRVALGYYRKLGAAPAREPGFWSSIKSRKTLSGQVIPGIGGATGRWITVDFRYKFNNAIYQDVQNAYATQISRMFPFFLSFEDCNEQDRIPLTKFYGHTDINWVFQSSVNKFLYSKKLKFTEAY